MHGGLSVRRAIKVRMSRYRSAAPGALSATKPRGTGAARYARSLCVTNESAVEKSWLLEELEVLDDLDDL